MAWIQLFFDDNRNLKRRREADAIMDAYLKSGKSLEEIMTFLKP